MKKTVAVFIVLFAIAMGTMVGWGFIDKQSKENSLPPSSAQPPSATPNSSAPGQSDSTQPSTKTYSLADVSKHKTQNDCWIVINSNVYNVTSYLDFHPGGADMILMVCGQDATKAYNTQGGRGRPHSVRADTQLANYLIGKLQQLFIRY